MRGQVSGFLTGDLFLTKPASKENIRFEEDSVIGVVLRTDDRTLLFRCGIGGLFRFRNEHLHTENGRTVYYPHYNETVVEVNNMSVERKNLELIEEDVSVRYRLTDELYIISEIEVTTYSPNYLVENDTVYAIEDPLLTEGQDYEEDSFLGLERVESVVRVRNTETGRSSEVRWDTVETLVENDEMNGAVKVQNPDTPNFLHILKTELREK